MLPFMPGLLSLRSAFQTPLARRTADVFEWVFEPLLRMRGLNRVYARFLAANGPADFFNEGLKVLDIRPRVSADDLARIPRQGPVVVVCNHPFGGIDGIVMGAVLQRVRPDCRLLVNFLLARLEGMAAHAFTVDPFGGEEAAARNLAGIRGSLGWLRKGGLLATWPAGEVAHFNWRQRRVIDPPWAENLAGLIRRSGATVVPVFFPGRNSLLFQVLGMLHPLARTLLLPREMLRRAGSEIELRVGQPITPARLAGFTSDRQMLDFLRLKTCILRSRADPAKPPPRFRPWLRAPRSARRGMPIVPAQAPEQLAADIAALPAEQRLVRHLEFGVYYARAAQIPRLLDEIGRLREITFRAVGEGTGLACDLDSYDPHYLHLFLWDHGTNQLAGAYRLGLTDEIFAKQGKPGLYTTTLFRYEPGALRALNPAIELGRSFISEAYQRRYNALGLIWRGIGQFIARNPRYRILFGPVSISKDYRRLSKNLMVHWLRATSTDPLLASKVSARKPPRPRHFGILDRAAIAHAVRDIEDVSALIAEIEPGEKGVPVLLRHYLKLNATLLSFNIDPAFNNSLDGLIFVDLLRSPAKTLVRYMGAEGAAAFLAFHEKAGNVAAATARPLPLA
jgi:putative hemolysin